MVKRIKIILIVIFAVGLFLRVFNIGALPDGLQGDEASHGYNAFAVLNEGTDEYGNRFPVYFQSIGDYKYPVYVYLTIPFVALFGLNETSTRMVSALAGSLEILALFFLIRKISKNDLLALFISGILAISSWHIFFSRGAFESNLGILLSTLTMFFFINFLEKRRKLDVILTLFFFLLSIFSYPAFRALLPGMVFLIFIVFGFFEKKETRKNLLIGLVTFLIIFAINIISLIPSESRVRANSLSGTQFTNLQVDNASLELEDGIANPGQTFLTRFYHNKIATFGINYISQYLNHFNPDFLFINGDKTRQMYNIPNAGLLYLFEIPFLLIGLIYLATNQKKIFWVGLFWILFSTIPSALANEPPNSERWVEAVPGFMIFSGAGLYALWKYLERLRTLFRVGVIVILILVVLLNTSYVFHQYVDHFPFWRPWTRDVGKKELVEAVNKFGPRYKNVVMPEDPYIFFLFYNKIKPSEFLNKGTFNEGKVGKWETVNTLGNIVFKMPTNCPKVGKVHVLYICKGQEVPRNAKIVQLIRYKDLVPAYILIEYYPLSEIKDRPPLPSQLNYMVEVDRRNDGVIPDSESRFW